MQRRAELLDWNAPQPAADAGARALAALERGELVALPTETLYVLAARADSAPALERLRALGGSDPARPLAWHVPGKASLAAFARLSPLVVRLVERYWPGPLTLLLPGAAQGLEGLARSGWTAVRCPVTPATQNLLAAAPFPLAAVEAQRDAGQVLEVHGGDLALVLDGGPARLGEPAVVLQVGPGRFRVLREGILDAAKLRATAGLDIAFVCTGNTCRSPMAEGLARALLAERLGVPPGRLDEFGFTLQSMGVFAAPGAPASQNAIDTLRDQGIDISQHAAQVALPESIAGLDRVYALTRSHLDALHMLLAPGKDQHCELLDPQGRDIPDPVGGPRSAYEKAAAQIRKALLARLDEWA